MEGASSGEARRRAPDVKASPATSPEPGTDGATGAGREAEEAVAEWKTLMEAQEDYTGAASLAVCADGGGFRLLEVTSDKQAEMMLEMGLGSEWPGLGLAAGGDDSSDAVRDEVSSIMSWRRRPPLAAWCAWQWANTGRMPAHSRAWPATRRG